MAQEKKVLQAQLAQLDADSRYQRRETLVGPAGTLQQELEASREALEPPLQTACDRFESQLEFTDLLEVGYDTPSFKEHWWNAGYWHHWAVGDRICKALGMKHFGDDVIPAYKAVAEPRDTMRADVKRLRGRDRCGPQDRAGTRSSRGSAGEARRDLPRVGAGLSR